MERENLYGRMALSTRVNSVRMRSQAMADMTGQTAAFTKVKSLTDYAMARALILTQKKELFMRVSGLLASDTVKEFLSIEMAQSTMEIGKRA
jgi:hypothetical protein